MLNYFTGYKVKFLSCNDNLQLKENFIEYEFNLFKVFDKIRLDFDVKKTYQSRKCTALVVIDQKERDTSESNAKRMPSEAKQNNRVNL